MADTEILEPAAPEATEATAHATTESRRARFTRWAKQRPFLGGAAMILGGVIVVVFPFTPVPNYVTAGVALGSFDRGSGMTMVHPPLGSVGGLALIVLGCLTLTRPDRRRFYGIAGVIAGLVSFALNHLGGFVVGMLLGIVGGALAYSWVPGPRPGKSDDSDDGDRGGPVDDDVAAERPTSSSASSSSDPAPMLPFSSSTSSSRP